MEAITNPTPKYRDLRFNKVDTFNRWLDEKATKIIWFEDEGQDLNAIWIDDEGEILHCNLQTEIWCGRFVNVNELKEGEPVKMHFEHTGWRTMMKLIVEKIESLK